MICNGGPLVQNKKAVRYGPKVPARLVRAIAAGEGAGAIALEALEALGVPLVAISVQDDAE